MVDINPTSHAKDVILSRFYKALVANIILQVFLLGTFLMVTNASIVQPLVWFREVFQYVRTLNTWLRLFPIVIIIIVEGIIYTQDFTTIQTHCSNRFSLFMTLFSLRNILLCIFQQISGGLLVFIYLSFLTDNCQLSKPCKEQFGDCIIEQNLFYILNGFWIGFLFRIYEGICQSNITVFPPVQLREFSQIRILPVLGHALKHATTPTILFSIWYYFWGYIPRSMIITYFDLQVEDLELDSIGSLFGSSLLINSMLLSTFFLATMFSIKHIFTIMLTEQMKFTIEPDGCSLPLHEALGKGPYILKTLASRDFYEMAVNDDNRRQLVFSLTQPGGHPKNWRNLLQPCLSAINAYNEELEAVINNNKVVDNLSGLMKVPGINQQPHLRMLTARPIAIMAQPDKRKFPLEAIENSVKSAVVREVDNFLCALYKKPFVYFFFGEIAEFKLKSLLYQAQYIIWITQGLAALTSASLYEDKYGIVQNDLPVILTYIVQLKQNIDKLFKLGLLPKKNINHDESLHQIKVALRSAVKRSIFMITVTFRDFMKDIPLSPEISQALQFFVTFREE